MTLLSQNIAMPDAGKNSLPRIKSVDVLRGIIMVIMALDHTRDYFSNLHHDPLDFNYANVFYFFTRWITHFCAPVFVFLSGTSAYLSIKRGKSHTKAAKMLFTRGLMLIIFEITIIRFGWAFNFDYHAIFVQVIWVLGWCMIFLSAFIFLPMPAIAGVGLLLIFGANAFDSVHSDSFTIPMIWDFFHQSDSVFLFNHSVRFFILYPVIPWVGVMMVGYCLGYIMQMPLQKRNKRLLAIGFSAMLLFIILRGINIYGDPHPWKIQDTAMHSVLDFIKCQKYPPSLLYLLMTLGPAITLMPLLENISAKIAGFFSVYGRVPLFYYILHIYLIHTLQLIIGLSMGYPLHIFTDTGSMFNPKLVWGFSLGWVYVIWVSVVLILYYPCRWYMKIKMKHKKWWLSYL